MPAGLPAPLQRRGRIFLFRFQVAFVALSIKNIEAERLARELAGERGTTVTRAVIDALDDALRRTRGRKAAPSIRNAILDLGRRGAQRQSYALCHLGARVEELTHQVEELTKRTEEQNRRAGEKNRRWFVLGVIITLGGGWLFWRLPPPQPQGRDVRVSGGALHSVRGGGTPITPRQVADPGGLRSRATLTVKPAAAAGGGQLTSV